ncbi:tetratricopeptide repeat protein [Geitlerinema splendidum]|nr:tetratricopeptide repeat protein [Geitlerinema splendidum]
MLERLTLFLGPARLRAIVIVIAVTGLLSLMLNVVVDEYDWVRPVQSLLAFGAVIGVLVIVMGRMDPVDRARWAAIAAPAIGALILAATVLPQFALPLAGAAVGWVVAGLFVFRSKAPTEYQRAVKFLRRGQLDDAIQVMNEVIRNDQNDPRHYRFRAELLRLNGKIDRARKDYMRMTELDPESAIAFNGLAEVELQAGKYESALAAGLKAAELAPDEWVALYNLGMIEDRLQRSEEAAEHLRRALSMKVPDARHRLLIHFYLARALARMGDREGAAEQAAQLRRLKGGLEEWEKILENEQAETLRGVLGEDIRLAAMLVDGRLTPEALAEASNGT